jgi:subtilisin-like proprotein convertase family protein
MKNITGRASRLMVLTGLATCCWLASSAQSQRAQPQGGVNVGEGLGLAAFTIQQLTLERHPASKEVTVTVTLDGVERTLSMAPYNMRSPELIAFTDLGAAGLHYFEPAQPTTYRGVVQGEDDSSVAASLGDDGSFRALILSGPGAWSIQPVRDVDPTAPASQHAVYRLEDVSLPPPMCGVIDDAIAREVEGEEDPGGIAGSGTSGGRQIDIGLDADLQFFQLNGSSVPNTINDMEAVINAVESLYQREVNISFRITGEIVRTTQAPYSATTTPGTLLNEFATIWNNNHGGIPRDVGQLFTGKDLAGTTIGIAVLNSVCSTGNPANAYSLVQSRWTTNFAGRISVSAHELGHTLSAPHCDGNPTCGIMCSGLGGCTGQITTFGVSAGTITAYANGTAANCLNPVGACCVGATCSQVTAAECAQAGGTWTAGVGCRTRTTYTANPNLAIPDGTGVNVSSTINVPDNFTVSDVNVRLTINHTYVGDLIVELTHNGVTFVSMIDRMGHPAINFGCPSNNLNIWLNDESGGGPVETLCGFGDGAPVPASGPSFLPQSPLSNPTLQGVNANGAWTLRVRDMAPPDPGTLVSWSLDLERAGTDICQPLGACCVGTTCTQTTQSACTGTWTAGQACTQDALITGAPNLAIPDGNPTGVTNNITVTQNFNITDLNVYLVIGHTWVGDLTVTLQHNGGTPRTLINRPQSGNCLGDNYSVILDDEGTSPIQTLCGNPQVPGSPPNYIPFNTLSAFDGQNINGTWTIRVSDALTPDVGSLVSWGIRATGGPIDFCQQECEGDTDNDGDVDADDLTNVILQWGTTCPCTGDVDDDNDVDSDDLVLVVLAWGPC